MWQLVPFLDPRTPFRGGGGSSHGRGFGTQSNYSSYKGSAYGNYLTGASVSNYDAGIGGYNSDWTSSSFNDSCRCWIPGVVSVTDDMATPMSSSSQKRGWHLGDDIANLTAKGCIPSWSAVRQRYWKNVALYHPELYPNYVNQMKKGLAPIGEDGFPMELHHPKGREGIYFFYFIPVTHTEHQRMHYGE